ncbi:MAG TPA: potassium-transporting ATPase subunit KdpA [Burkholderiales bacterium]|nr:potassium-transporting ATPase subunit KdpA [Burkholderiales bacterium]
MNAFLQCAVYVIVLIALAKPLGAYMANVYEGRYRFLAPLENLVYRLSSVKPEDDMGWKRYLWATLWFNLFGFIAVYALQRLQDFLPLNPQKMAAVSADSSFNTAVSFITNTNWQGYAGETTMSYLTQMLGLAVQNFLSAATGMAVLIALIRGFARKQANGIGNFWADVTRSTVYILLPLSLLLACVLVTQGVVQTFAPYKTVQLLQPVQYVADGKTVTATTQTLPLGPAASQVAIKQLGTNGGGFFNVNSAHPFENPTPLSDFLELLSILLIGAALCYTFGRMIGDTRQGWALLAAMTIVFVGFLAICLASEQAGNPILAKLGVSQPLGNMEGKELRFGVTDSALWATATTAASNGSVNAMHDSFTPLGGLVPMVLMQLGEIVFGGVGSGLYGMLVFAIVAVFIAGLMVGRTPEYVGKKIESFEMKMAALAVLFPFAAVLIGTAVAVVLPAGTSSMANPGAHGFSEVLYAFSSAGNNNGSAFAGLNANTPFYNTALGIAMWVSRYWLIVPVLALAGSLARKKRVPPSTGTLPTHTPLFVGFLVGTVLVIGALTFVPALALGPLVEQLQLWSR